MNFQSGVSGRMSLQFTLLIGMSFALSASPGLLAGQDEVPAKKELPIVVSGTVKDKEGRSVNGARVLARAAVIGAMGSLEWYEVAGAMTDSEGRFELRGKRPVSDRLTNLGVVARGHDGSIGFTSTPSNRDGEVAIVLEPVHPYRGRLVTADGKAIAGARIIPTGLGEGSFKTRKAGQRSCGLPKEFSKVLTSSVADSGDFEIPGVPKSGYITAEIDAGEYGIVNVKWNLDGPVTLQLNEPGALQFQLEPVPEEDQATQIRISVSNSTFRTEPDAEFFMWCSRTVSCAADGSAEIRGLQPGKYFAHKESPRTFPFVESPISGWTWQVVESAMTKQAIVRLLPAVSLRGRLVDKATGKALPQAYISVHLKTEGLGIFFRVNDAMTDDKGSFELFAPEGEIVLHGSRENDTAFHLFRPKEMAETMTVRMTDDPIEVPDVVLDR